MSLHHMPEEFSIFFDDLMDADRDQHDQPRSRRLCFARADRWHEAPDNGTQRTKMRFADGTARQAPLQCSGTELVPPRGFDLKQRRPPTIASTGRAPTLDQADRSRNACRHERSSWQSAASR
jgi:hypothetical protein